MKENSSTRVYGWFYSHACKKQLKAQYGGQMLKECRKEYRAIIRRAETEGYHCFRNVLRKKDFVFR